MSNWKLFLIAVALAAVTFVYLQRDLKCGEYHPNKKRQLDACVYLV